MRFIHVWSYSCADYLMKQMNEDHEKRRVYYYGFQVIIGAIVKGVLLTLIALLLGALKPTLIALLVFASIRVLAGGYHMNTYGKCITVSLALFILTGCIVEYTYKYWTLTQILLLIGISFTMAIAFIIKWAPADTPNKPITEAAEIKKFKTLSLLAVIVFLVIAYFLVYYKMYMYVIAGCFGLTLEAFIITPLGYRLFDKLSGKVDQIKKVA